MPTSRLQPNGTRAMNRIASAIFGASALFASAPASAVTLDNGVVLITQADALAGGLTPGDTPGFPITLSVSGSYRLASNLLVNTAVNGIDVTAPEITIDFAGFRIAGSGVGSSAIFTALRALTVRNGTIRGFTTGIYAIAADALAVKRMRIVDNEVAVLAGAHATVSYSNLSRNEVGIQCKNFCTVEGSIMNKNGFGVIVIGIGGIMTGNTISANTVGLFGVNPFEEVSIGDNSFVGNTGASVLGTLPLDPNQPPP